MKNSARAILFFLLLQAFALAQSSRELSAAFDSAAQEFGVPSQVLKGIAFAETRWEQLQWPEGDTASCTGMPHPYGIMSLWDNDHFGHSLRSAADLIQSPPQQLKERYAENIRGAAALLKKLHREQPLPDGTNRGEIESWTNAIAAYSGIPQPELAYEHALDVMSFINRGYHRYHIEWDATPLKLDRVRPFVREKQRSAPKFTRSERTVGQPDYPDAKWTPAYPGHWYTTGYGKYFVVIHDMEGYYASTISYFQTTAEVSAHFCVNGLSNGNDGTHVENRPGDAPAGEITQMVELQYYAWHVRCWNRYTVGIEHEGFVSNPAWYTEAMYRSSAKLTAFLCNQFNIPMDRNHVIGHNQWLTPSWQSWVNSTFNPSISPTPAMDPTCNDHTDPGQYWAWDHYMSLVKGDTLPPKILSSLPAAGANNVRAYKPLTLRFSTYMDTATVNAAFSISPTVVGTKSWDVNWTSLTFAPTTHFSFSTTYTVTIDSGAKGKSYGYSVDGNGDGVGGDKYEQSFTTEPPDGTPPSIRRLYPTNGVDNVSSLAAVYLEWNEPVKTESVSKNLQWRKLGGAQVAVMATQIDSLNDHSFVLLEPTLLEPNTTYEVKLSAGVADLYGNETSDSVFVQFRTSPQTQISGVSYEGFELNTRSWISPLQSPGTTLVDSAQTTFSFSPERKRSGSYSGRLTYGFRSASGGKVVLDALGRPTLDSYSELGVWINGDLSYNRLGAIFQPGDQSIDWGAIDWRGWKYLSVPLSSINGPGKKFSDFALVQSDTGNRSGTLFFDDLVLNPIFTLTEQRGAATFPKMFTLLQNFPNPFNPSTAIEFQLPKTARVDLKIFDLLGRETATLVSEERDAGIYRVSWDASGFPSGVYFYRLTSGPFIEARKLLLMK